MKDEVRVRIARNEVHGESPEWHVYLFASLSLVAIFFLGWLAWPGLRGSSLLSAGLLTPFSVLGVAFVPEYWKPDHCFTFIRGVGIEDILFCFGCGGVGWIAAAVGSGARLHDNLSMGPFLLRFISWSAVALVGVGLASAAGRDILTAVVVGFTCSGVLVLWRAPRTVRLVIPGAMGFTLVYTSVAWAVLVAAPHSTSFWVSDSISGYRIYGLPIEELVWAASFGATWPVVFAYCLGDTWIGR